MLFKLILFSGFAGATVFIGGLLANLFDHHIKDSPIKYEVVHTLMSFRPGITLSPLALVLVPKGMETLSAWGVVGSFSLGAVLFMLIRSLA